MLGACRVGEEWARCGRAAPQGGAEAAKGGATSTGQAMNEINEANVQWLGQVAYEAHGEANGWHALDGSVIPPWSDVPDVVRDTWEATAMKVMVEASVRRGRESIATYVLALARIEERLAMMVHLPSTPDEREMWARMRSIVTQRQRENGAVIGALGEVTERVFGEIREGAKRVLG